MTQSSYKLTDILQPLSEHSMKHASEFSQPSLGKPINVNNIQDMSRHILHTLFDAETKSFKGHNNRDCFYNAKTNTVVIINSAADRNNKAFGGTCFRPREKDEYFKELYKRESRSLNQKPVEHEKNGIVALRPEIAKQFAQDYLQKQGQNLTTFKKAEITPQRPESNHPQKQGQNLTTFKKAEITPQRPESNHPQKQGQNLTTFKKAEITPQRPEANHPRTEKSLSTLKPSSDLTKQQSHKRAR